MVKKSLKKVSDCFCNPLFVSAVFVAILLWSGALSPAERKSFTSLFYPAKIVSIEGFLASNPVKTSLFDSYRADFSVSKCFLSDGTYSSCTGNVTVYIPGSEAERLYPGKLYTSSFGQGILFENGAMLNLSVENVVLKGERTSFKVVSAKSLGWKGNRLESFFYRFRGMCRLQFKRLMYSWGSAGGLLLSLFSGSREYTEIEVSRGFRNSGLSHILALSGMHLSLFGGIAFFLGKKASSRNLADAIRLLANLFFLWFAGSSPSLFRAFLSCLLIYLSSLIRINAPSPVSILSLTFLLHVMIFPSHAKEAAFILSYLSLSGIILLSKSFRRFIHPLLPYKIRDMLAKSMAAQLLTSPASLRLFGKVMPVGIIAGVAVSPAVTAFIYSGAIGIVICLIFPILSQPIHVIINAQYQIIKFLVLFFERI